MQDREEWDLQMCISRSKQNGHSFEIENDDLKCMPLNEKSSSFDSDIRQEDFLQYTDPT